MAGPFVDEHHFNVHRLVGPQGPAVPGQQWDTLLCGSATNEFLREYTFSCNVLVMHPADLGSVASRRQPTLFPAGA